LLASAGGIRQVVTSMISVPSVDGRCKQRENERKKCRYTVVYSLFPTL
jgi:Cys-tRNA synthase (O-phospho-L-seryl-tRNA:Cys-tRNA synthase)